MITSFVRIFALIGVGIARFLMPRIMQFYDAKFSFDRTKTRKETHQEYQEVYTNMEFDPELSFAESLTTIFIMITFGSMMPLIIPASLLQLLVIYYRDKLLISNTYIFFSFIDINLHAYTRNLLVMAFFISCLFNTWVFGNTEIFANNKNLESQNPLFKYFTFKSESDVEYSVTSLDSKLYNSISDYPELNQDLNSGYAATFRVRSRANSLQKTIQIFLLVYAIFTVLRWLFNAFASTIIRNRLKEGIKKFQSSASNSQFEDLIDQNEILDIITLEEKTQGREIPFVRLREMMRQRRIRLVRNYQRMAKKKEQLRSSIYNGTFQEFSEKHNKSVQNFDLSPQVSDRIEQIDEVSDTGSRKNGLFSQYLNKGSTEKNAYSPSVSLSKNQNYYKRKTSLQDIIEEQDEEIEDDNKLASNQKSLDQLNNKPLLNMEFLIHNDSVYEEPEKKNAFTPNSNKSSVKLTPINKNILNMGDASPSSALFKNANSKLKLINSLKIQTINDKGNKKTDDKIVPFFTLSSYDFRLNPMFKDHFVGEVSEEYLHKYKQGSDGNVNDAKKTAAHGLFVALLNNNNQ